VDSVYDELVRCHLDYTAEGFQVYASCYRLLSAMDDPRAPEIYRLAQAHLAVRNDALEDEAARRTFRALPLHQPLYSHTDFPHPVS
jgi:hypothetical protein